MIDKENAKLLIQELAVSAKDLKSKYTFIQFGSSITEGDQELRDIDLLIISKTDYCNGEFRSKIQELRMRLHAGENNSGFHIECKELETHFKSILDKYQSKELVFVPKFIVGPVNSKPNEIIIHVKGPLTTLQFKEFCKTFPFHGKSILKNYRIICGDLNILDFQKFIHVSLKELRFLTRVLVKRSSTSDCRVLSKCIEKMLDNIEIYAQANGQERMLPRNFSLETVRNSNDPKFLKEQFNILIEHATSEFLGKRTMSIS